MNCIVRANKKLADDFHYLSLAPDKPVGEITPGQFLMIQCAVSTDPLLRRPMSVADYEPDGSRFGLVIQVMGKGTRLLADLTIDDHLDVLGPFGTGFAELNTNERLWIVAGGTGVAPFIGLAQLEKDKGKDITIFLGARNGGLLLYKNYFQEAGLRVMTSTEDGSDGYKGLVTGLLKEELGKGEPPGLLFTCGPAPMMRVVAGIARDKSLKCYVSLENRMACGFGACLGCVTKVIGEDRYTTVCRKGPVFDAATVEI